MTTLIERIIKNSPTKHTSVLSESTFFTDKDTVQTDIPIVNIAFSGTIDGGFTAGLTLLAGPSRVFKSYLALNCVKNYLERYSDGVCILYDSEGGITPEYLITMGVDPSRVVHVPIEHIEMLKFDIVKQLKEINRGDKVIIVIDSIGNTASLKELEDALEEKSKAEMQRAKSIKGLFRMVTPSLVVKDIPCVAICHTYQEMALYPKQIISGGTGLIYSANTAFIISRAQEKEGTEVTGWNFTLNVEKSRFVKEKSKLTFRVMYDGGIYKYSGLLELAIESGHLVKDGHSYRFVDSATGEVSETKVKEKSITEEMWNNLLADKKFKEFIKNKYMLSNTRSMIAELADEEEIDE